jgi:phage tail-like protein
MAETGLRIDPFVAFRFEIRLDGLAVGGFSECTGLQVETETHDYMEGGLNTHIHKFPTRTKQTNLTLKRGIVDRLLWEWYYQLVQGQVQFRTGSVVVYEPSGSQPVMIWAFNRAFPSKWVGPELNATQNNVAVESFELCHHGLERIL